MFLADGKKAGGLPDGGDQRRALQCECEAGGTGLAQAGTCEADSGLDCGSHHAFYSLNYANNNFFYAKYFELPN